MAALTLYLRSTASSTVSGNSSVHQLSATEGSTSGGTADGTAFVETVNTEYNVGPGTATAITHNGTITASGKGWIYDTQPLEDFLSGTWTVDFELKRASGGTHTGVATCEVYKVTATTTVITAVTLIGTAATSAVSLTTSAARYSTTFSGSQITFASGNYLYIQFFWKASAVGTGVFSNLVDDSSSTVASLILTTATQATATAVPILVMAPYIPT
jgi:hypothetical protein